ncbi:hypothetical protein PPL_00379 [Heterostelium album PN500]|uniref:Adenylate cyclase-associated CAP C-terminal domain-containing protein n=1 Tax=Heterostelium pallidum (strain ATCC 26659 / Pp 5 / PN500) TaxID=670386 RepID=D3AWA5_HETP5|nr:hypothetical protein PPL_00379 [Heterostelium album PN500]EFA86578.1 hypothetical protein PPL_00379 [Heterostelium album PN500]|eukprot:XP_020438683.1 hypothetical protein PPL_00379 [Heterostelium album PN500]
MIRPNATSMESTKSNSLVGCNEYPRTIPPNTVKRNRMSNTNQPKTKAEAEVLADQIATVADVNNSLPQPKGQEATSIKTDIEDKKADAQLGSGAKDQEVFFVKDENKVTKELDKSVSPKATVYFKGCKDGNYTISARVVKILIEACQRCTFTFKGRIFTNTIEAWKTVDLNLHKGITKSCILNDQVKTLQVDMTSRMNVHFDTRASLHSLVWSGVNDMKLRFVDEKDFIYQTGFEQMKQQYPGTELSFTVDQFTTRIVKGDLITEQIVRLSNGYPTTEREAREFDSNSEANAKKAEEYVRSRLKESGITLGTLGMAKKETGRNDACPCNSE